MSQSSEHQQNVTEFADRHFARFVGWGAQLLTREVVATVTSVGRGSVLWQTEQGELAGQHIGTIRPGWQDNERFRRFGFSNTDQVDGLWIVEPSCYNPERQNIDVGADRAFAHWDGKNWKVVRANDDPPTHDEKNGWSAPSPDLTAPERDALKRVVQESGVMLDAAFTFGGNSTAYFELERELARRATNDGNEDSIRVLIDPWKSHDLAHCLHPSVYHLKNIGPALHRAITDRGTDSSDDIMPLHPIAAEALAIDPVTGIRLHEGAMLPSFPPEWSIFGISPPEQ